MGSYTRNDKLTLVVPRDLQREIIQSAHCPILSGHLGYRKTADRLAAHYYWYQMRDQVATFVRQCSVCAANTRGNKTPKAPLGGMRVGAPLDRLGTDLIGPLPLTPRGNRHILVVQDYFTKWVEIYAVADATAETCADKILNEYLIFSQPEQSLSSF